MSSFKKKNGYVLLPTLDPDDTSSKNEIGRTKSKPPDLKPGLFVHFSKDRRMNRFGHASESEDIEMSEIKPRRPKHRKLKSPKSPSSKRPHQEFVEEPVLDGDTIQRIALRYSCPVSSPSSHKPHVFYNNFNVAVVITKAYIIIMYNYVTH